MQFSDWLTIILSLLGIFSGAGISWMFFRTQLLADFTSLHEKLVKLNVPRDVNAVVNPRLGEISSQLQELTHKVSNINITKGVGLALSPKLDTVCADIRELKTKIDIIEQLNNSKEIASIKNTVEKLDRDLNSAVREILSNVKAQQFELAERIQATFKSQSETATNIVRDAFSAEISKFVKNSTDKEKLLTSLVNSFMEGMRVMGDYQKKNIEIETSNSISDIEKKIANSIENVFEEVVSLKQQLVSIPKQSRRL